MSQQNKTTLQSAINAQIADNTSGAITAANVRNNFINMSDSLLFNTGSIQAVTGSLTVTGGVTGSLLGTATNALTASYLNNAPIIQSFGGKWSYQDTYGSLELNQITGSTVLYSSRIFSTAIHNYWLDLSVSLGSFGGGATTTLKLYASANGSSLDALLGTYTIASGSVSNFSVNKMQRTFWMAAAFIGEEQYTTYIIYGANPSVSLKSDELSTGSQSTTEVGINAIAYPYLVITGESTALRVYRLGPSRITYG